MSDYNLPDDPAQWPTDPYEVLGVGRQVDRRELRRAYTRLIRRFKPEHFPTQFRLIRDAYESLENYLQYQEFFGVESSSGDEVQAEEATVDLPDNGEEKVGETTSLSSVSEEKVATHDEASAAWQIAKEGRLTEAYRRLQELTQRRTNDADLYVRLYWLLVLFPNLDPKCDRRQWLTTGLSATGFDGQLLELYIKELQGDPEEILQPRCRKLLECRSPLASWARFVGCYWELAGLSNHWEMIAQDMQVLREEIIHADRTIWARLLLTGTEQYLWQDDPQAYDEMAQACRDELEGYEEEHWELSHELDRCDYVAELTAGRRLLKVNYVVSLLSRMKRENWPIESRMVAIQEKEMPDFLRILRDLLRCSWVQPFEMVQPQILLLLRPLVENPRQAINDFDRLNNTSSSVLHQLNSLVEILYQRRHDFSDDGGEDQVAEETETFLRTHDWGIYEKIRNDILFYCISNQITLDAFRSAAEKADLPLQRGGLLERLHCDLPLRCLTTACQAFWS